MHPLQIQARPFRDDSDFWHIRALLNAGSSPCGLELALPVQAGGLVDLLNPGDSFPITAGSAQIDPLPSCWLRILKIDTDQ